VSSLKEKYWKQFEAEDEKVVAVNKKGAKAAKEQELAAKTRAKQEQKEQRLRASAEPEPAAQEFEQPEQPAFSDGGFASFAAPMHFAGEPGSGPSLSFADGPLAHVAVKSEF